MTLLYGICLPILYCIKEVIKAMYPDPPIRIQNSDTKTIKQLTVFQAVDQDISYQNLP